MFAAAKSLARAFKRELAVYRLVLKHKRTPLISKCLLWLAIAYLLMPFDIIPDWLPVIGQLDDLVIVPVLVYLALKLIPGDVLRECRARACEKL